MHEGPGELMLRNLFLAGLTALLLASLASSAHAARGTTTRKKSEASQPGQTSAPEADRPLRPASPVRKKVVVKARSRTGAARRQVARRVHNAVVNQGLIRQSWTIADLNPMPALLDLDDTVSSLRRATDAIVQAMRR